MNTHKHRERMEENGACVSPKKKEREREREREAEFEKERKS